MSPATDHADGGVETRMLRSNVRILLAEDNLVNQRLAVLQLQKLGLRADVVANGLEALEATRRLPYDLVLMDCQMPEMDGYEATREIRRREGPSRRTPIIAFTANVLPGDRERCLAAGMDDYLAKPALDADFRRILSTWLPEQSLAATPTTEVEGVARDGDGDALDAATLDGLRELSGGDASFIAELADIFLSDAAARVEAISRAAAQHDGSLLADAAHGLKSAAGNIGALHLRELASLLEQAGRGLRLDEIAEIVRAITDEFDRVVVALEKLVP